MNFLESDHALNRLVKRYNENGINLHDEIKKRMDGTNNFYKILSDIEGSDKVFYLAIFAFSIFFFSKINITSNAVLGAIIGIIIIIYLYTKDEATHNSFHQDMIYRIQAINTITKNKYEYLYLDTELVELITRIIDYRKYSVSEFDGMVHQINLFLKLMYQVELGTEKCADNIDVAKVIANNAMNKLTTFFHNIENSPIQEKKLELSIQILQNILTKHIDEMIYDCNNTVKEKGLNIGNRLIHKSKFPAPNDLETEVVANRYRNINFQ